MIDKDIIKKLSAIPLRGLQIREVLSRNLLRDLIIYFQVMLDSLLHTSAFHGADGVLGIELQKAPLISVRKSGP